MTAELAFQMFVQSRVTYRSVIWSPVSTWFSASCTVYLSIFRVEDRATRPASCGSIRPSGGGLMPVVGNDATFQSRSRAARTRAGSNPMRGHDTYSTPSIGRVRIILQVDDPSDNIRSYGPFFNESHLRHFVFRKGRPAVLISPRLSSMSYTDSYCEHTIASPVLLPDNGLKCGGHETCLHYLANNSKTFLRKCTQKVCTSVYVSRKFFARLVPFVRA